MKKNILTGLRESLHIFYPKRCPICDEILWLPFWSQEYPICVECKKKIEYVIEPVCKKCGKPISDERGLHCQDCMRYSHKYLQGKALWIYNKKVKQSIYRFKYKNRREYGISYARELVRRYEPWILRKEIQAIVPIPLHKKKRRKRGFNQAEIIALEIGNLLQIPVEKHLLERCVDTRPQKELNDKERKINLKNAFKVSKNKVKLERILLVDDIYTTGSTIDGAANALKEAGVIEIYFLSVCIGKDY